MTTYREQLEVAQKDAKVALMDAAKKGSVKSIAEAQSNAEKVASALAAAKSE